MRRDIAINPAVRVRRKVLFVVLVLAALASCKAQPTPTLTPAPTAVPPTATALPPTPSPEPIAATQGLTSVFITTDMSSDDFVALLYLLRHPDVEVLGIGSADGVAHVGPAATGVLRLLTLLGREDIPVAVGSDKHLEGDHSFPSAWRGGADRLFGLDLPQAKAQPVAASTAELLAEVVKARPGQVTVVLLGAHTDLALALRANLGLAAQIKAVHMMGGAVHVPGNINAEYGAVANKTAEWNLWLDYRAAAEVFSSGIPLTMAPLDATNLVRVERAYSEQFAAAAQSPAAKAVAQLWNRQSGSFYIWDAVAAVGLTVPQAMTWEMDALSIVTDKPDDLGQTVLQQGQAPSFRVCIGVDVPALQDDLIQVLNR